jgi:Lrp/AsnC family transcriptional regulator, regulator for asnA, asnC and gidA
VEQASHPDEDGREDRGEPRSGIRLDDVDSAIIRHLQEDGRRSYRQIGRDLDLSEGTIRFRTRRMVESGALRIVAIADPFRLGYGVLAFVLLRVRPGEVERITDELTSWSEVTYVSSCTGQFDTYIQVVCRDHDDLFDLLSRRIPSLDGVTATETFMELKIHKISYRYPAQGPQAGE